MKKGWKIIGIAVGVVVILVGGLLAWFAWEGSPKEIVAVADEFKPDASWQLTDEQIIPPKHDCIDVHCPSVHRIWQTPKVLTLSMLQKRLEASSWNNNVRVEEGCRLNAIDPESKNVCSASGYKGKYEIKIYVNGDSSAPIHNEVSLFIDYK